MAGSSSADSLMSESTRSIGLNSDGHLDVCNDVGDMGFSSDSSPLQLLEQRRSKTSQWQRNYQEAAIYLQEGENNDKYDTHPQNFDALPAFQIAHNKWFYLLDLVTSLVLLFLAGCERPAVMEIALPVGVHGSLELFCLLVLSMDLGIRLKWLGIKMFFSHKRTSFKIFLLLIMLVEAIVVIIRQRNHFRLTRALRPLFLLDSYYCKDVRRFARQILQSVPPIFDMIVLLLFFMLIFSILGFYLFSDIKGYTYFQTIQDSFVSLFVLLTTANYPDVMMPAYNESRWYASFFIVYLILELFFLMNLLLAVVYDTFSTIEKEKLRKLYFHKQRGCQFAFRLLVNKKNPFQIHLRHFVGMMNYFKPKKCRRDVYLLFKSLNTSKSGTLSLDEFYRIYELGGLQWKLKGDDEIWSSGFYPPFKTIFRVLNWFVTWRYFEYYVYLMIAANFIWIMVEAIGLSVRQTDVKSYNFTTTWASMIFVYVYVFEALLKILGKGPKEYFTTGWDLFDFLVTLVSVIGVLGELFNDNFFYIMVLRPFRLLRLFKIKRRYRDVLGTFFVIFSRLVSIAIAIMLLYYSFAIVGMEFFGNVNLTNCCKNTSVEIFYRNDNTTREQGYYYLNNFNNILVSGVTLFELTVVNNWFIIMDGYSYHVSEWYRIYFMGFYIVSMVVMTIVVAFVLDAFIFRIQYRRKMNCDNIEDHGVYRVEVLLNPDEVHMCEHTDAPLLGCYIRLATDVQNRVYRGERIRSREDFSLQMYSDEVKTWVEEEKKMKTEIVCSMDHLRRRSRANADLDMNLLEREISMRCMTREQDTISAISV